MHTKIVNQTLARARLKPLMVVSPDHVESPAQLRLKYEGLMAIKIAS